MDSQETLVLPGGGDPATPPPSLTAADHGYLDPETVESQWRLHTTPQELTTEAKQSIVDDFVKKQTLEQPKDDSLTNAKEKDGTEDTDNKEKEDGTEDKRNKEKKDGTEDTDNKEKEDGTEVKGDKEKKDGTEDKGKKKDKPSSTRKRLSVKRVKKTLEELKANHRRCCDAWHAKWIRKGVPRTAENEKIEAEKLKDKKPTESKHKRLAKSKAEKPAEGNRGRSVKSRAEKSKASKRRRSDKSNAKSSRVSMNEKKSEVKKAKSTSEHKPKEAGEKELKLGSGDCKDGLYNRGGLVKGFCWNQCSQCSLTPPRPQNSDDYSVQVFG